MKEYEQTYKLRHFTPLRYPGGKAKLASFIKAILRENRLLDGDYVEPYAGGAAIALELLFHEYVSNIHINDASMPIYAFWHSVLQNTEGLCRLITDKVCSVEEWDRQKAILKDPASASPLELGFATFYLNRTNRSGILNGGIIGGRDQSGPWKIDARFNAPELSRRIQAIASLADRITLTQMDAHKLLETNLSRWKEDTLIYLDPPYFKKGRDLYLDFYQSKDHLAIAELMLGLSRHHWIVSYDNVSEICNLYGSVRCLTYDIGYSARSASTGSEVMFFSDEMQIPHLSGPIKLTGESPIPFLQRAG